MTTTYNDDGARLCAVAVVIAAIGLFAAGLIPGTRTMPTPAGAAPAATDKAALILIITATPADVPDAAPAQDAAPVVEPQPTPAFETASAPAAQPVYVEPPAAPPVQPIQVVAPAAPPTVPVVIPSPAPYIAEEGHRTNTRPYQKADEGAQRSELQEPLGSGVIIIQPRPAP